MFNMELQNKIFFCFLTLPWICDHLATALRWPWDRNFVKQPHFQQGVQPQPRCKYFATANCDLDTGHSI